MKTVRLGVGVAGRSPNHGMEGSECVLQVSAEGDPKIETERVDRVDIGSDGEVGHLGVVFKGGSAGDRRMGRTVVTGILAQVPFSCEDLLLVGDSLNDSLAARAAGCPVVLLPYGYNGGKDVREQDCDAVIESLPELLKLIRKASSRLTGKSN